MRVVVDKFGNVITSFPVKEFLSLGAIGVTLFGDNAFGQTIDFFNPLSDLKDILDLLGSGQLDDDCLKQEVLWDLMLY